MRGPLTEVLIAAYRWQLPLGQGSVDYKSLIDWSKRSDMVMVLVRGRSVRGHRQLVDDNLHVLSAPLGGVPVVGLASFCIWVIVRYCALPRPSLLRLQPSDPVGAGLARICSWFRRPAAIVVHVQGPFFDPPSSLGRRGKVHRALQVFGSRKATVVRCASTESYEAARKLGIPSERLVVQWSRTDVARFASRQPAAQIDPPRVLTVGSLIELKGVDLLIRALGSLAPHFRIPLVVAGDGPERATLERLARQLDVRAEFLGRVNHDEIHRVFGQSPIFVLASRSEASPRVVMEAMAAGCAVIATRVGDIPEMLSDCGVTVPPDDVEALAAAVLSLVTDSQRRAELGNGARRRAEIFDFEDGMERLWRLGKP